jgi:hypothetical protein
MSDRAWHKELARSITDPTGKLRVRQAEVTAFNGQTRIATVKIGGSGTTAEVPTAEHLWPEVGRSVWCITDGIDLFAFAQVDVGRFPTARATKAADQAVANNTTEELQIDTTDYDPLGMVKLAPNYIECVVPGLYRASSSVRWATTSGAGQRTLQLFKNSTLVDRDNRGGSAAFSVRCACLRSW